MKKYPIFVYTTCFNNIAQSIFDGTFKSEGLVEVYNTQDKAIEMAHPGDEWLVAFVVPELVSNLNCSQGIPEGCLYSLTRLKEHKQVVEDATKVTEESLKYHFDRISQRNQKAQEMTVQRAAHLLRQDIEVLDDDTLPEESTDLMVAEYMALQALLNEDNHKPLDMERGKVLERLLAGEWINTEDIEKYFNIDFTTGWKLFEFSRTAEWNPAPLNGQKITTKFRLKQTKSVDVDSVIAELNKEKDKYSEMLERTEDEVEKRKYRALAGSYINAISITEKYMVKGV